MTDEPQQSDDNYPREHGTASALALVRRVVAPVLSSVPSPEERDDAWWNAHDARIRAELEREAIETRRIERTKRGAALKADGCFPARAVDAALATWPTDSAAMVHARNFVEGSRAVLVLAGGTGAGKSSAAAWTALMHAGNAPAFIRAAELEARGRYDKELGAWLRSRSMLVVDDLGVEVLDGRGAFRSALDTLIDEYYGDRKRLVITTNLRAKRVTQDEREELQFVERYGERVASRLFEVGVWGDCGTTDLRRAGRP